MKSDYTPRSLPSLIRRAANPKLLVVLAALALVWFMLGRKDGGASAGVFRTMPVQRGNLDVNVNATGTVQPEELVDVGAQIAGQIASLGNDKKGKPIDYGSEVEEGALLAKIDDALYRADVAQAEAQAKRANADLLQAKSKLYMAERDWERAQKLGSSDALSQSAFDGYRAAFDGAKAGIAVAEAAIAQAEATLAKAKQNLAYCTITSPVDGVVIDRRVSVGQTVVASLNAPSLFLIAKDLHRMQVWAAVNEADIGLIHIGQKVRFRVDAFPADEFEGTVGKVRLNASMTQNVVTYIVEINADNSDGKLLPYLTASATFEIAKRDNVLLVPTAALRWAPSEEQRGKLPDKTAETRESNAGTVWVADGGRARPIKVKTGGTDGSRIEVEGEGVSEGLEVIVGQQETTGAAQQSGTTNPFAPQPMRGRRGQR